MDICNIRSSAGWRLQLDARLPSPLVGDATFTRTQIGDADLPCVRGFVEAAIRFGIFLAIFAAVALAEWQFPKRDRVQPRAERWTVNIGMLVFDVVAQRLTVGAAAFAAATYARAHGWGLFHLLSWPYWIEGLLAFLILDFAIYLQHVMTHAVPLLWRLHQVHHTDLDVDLTTGIRFHPIEIILSALYKAAIVAALGPDPVDRHPVRGGAERFGRLHARQCPRSRSSTQCCAGRSARPTCIASTIRSSRTKPIPISASSCRSGIAHAAPCGRRRQGPARCGTRPCRASRSGEAWLRGYSRYAVSLDRTGVSDCVASEAKGAAAATLARRCFEAYRLTCSMAGRLARRW